MMFLLFAILHVFLVCGLSLTNEINNSAVSLELFGTSRVDNPVFPVVIEVVTPTCQVF